MFLATPVIRTVARMLLPSTKAERTRTRLLTGRTFILPAFYA